MIICVPVDPDGGVGHSWGRAQHLAIAHVEDGVLAEWRELAVGWDGLHDATSEGGHHARIARFLREHEVQVVLAGHMGQPMRQMLGRLGIDVHLGVAGDARAAVLAAVSRPLH